MLDAKLKGEAPAAAAEAKPAAQPVPAAKELKKQKAAAQAATKSPRIRADFAGQSLRLALMLQKWTVR